MQVVKLHTHCKNSSVTSTPILIPISILVCLYMEQIRCAGHTTVFLQCNGCILNLYLDSSEVLQ